MLRRVADQRESAVSRPEELCTSAVTSEGEFKLGNAAGVRGGGSRVVREPEGGAFSQAEGREGEL